MKLVPSERFFYVRLGAKYAELGMEPIPPLYLNTKQAIWWGSGYMRGKRDG